MNEASTSPLLRRRLWPRRSELMRPTDWIEAAVLVAVITAALVLLPVALAMGSETYADQTRVGQEQSRTRHPATATLVEDAPQTSFGTRGETVSGVADVPARWTLSDGTERTGTVRANEGAKSGSPVSIWLDDAGNPVDEPITNEQAALGGRRCRDGDVGRRGRGPLRDFPPRSCRTEPVSVRGMAAGMGTR